MKTEEMADLLDGLASFTEKFMAKGALSDVRTVSGCLRQFSGETVAAFCNFVTKAKEGKPARESALARVDQSKVDLLVHKLDAFLNSGRTYEYSQIVQLMGELNQLKLAEIKAISERIEGPVAPRTKPAMLKALRSWLESIKLSADQASFNLSGSGKAS